MRAINTYSSALCFCIVLSVAAAPSRAEDLKGSAALKNNYVFSTGTKIDSNPVAQLWLHKRYNSGLFLDLWSNWPLEDGNPSYSAEVDYKIGFGHDTRLGHFDYSIAYYDIQLPRVFDLDNNFYAPEIYWRRNKYSVLATYFGGESARDGFRVSLGYHHALSSSWTLNTHVNYANGPFSAQEAVIGKLNFTLSLAKRWLSRVSVELSEPLYLEDSNDRRDRDITFSLYHDFGG